MNTSKINCELFQYTSSIYVTIYNMYILHIIIYIIILILIIFYIYQFYDFFLKKKKIHFINNK